jgi:hypothetical protein
MTRTTMRNQWPIAFHEAGHAVVSWNRGIKIHRATIIPSPEFRGRVEHSNPLRAVRLDWDRSDRARRRAESMIVVCLAGPEAQRRHSPRSGYLGASDHAEAADLASRFNGSDEAVNAYLKWLSVVARDELAVLWPLVERVAHALVAKRTLTAAEVKALLARA